MENIQVTIEQYESYCNLELLQKLYNKGFRFKLDTEGNRVTNNLAEQRFNDGDVSYCDNYITYSVVVEWLRVNHGIWVSSDFSEVDESFTYKINLLNSENLPRIFTDCGYDSPQKAYSAALDYILKELI
jgi:hypothetical protein